MKKKIISMILMMVLAISIPLSAKAQDIKIYRIAGGSRVETAIKVSQVINKKSRYVVVVSGENYPDGLAGGVLASSIGGPVLLAYKSSIPAEVVNEIKRLGATEIFLLGGTGSVSTNAENTLKKLGKVTRISGSNRYETAANVASYLQGVSGVDKSFVAIANGGNFPDSLSAGGYLANKKIPLILTQSGSLPGVSINYMEKYLVRKGIIVGGEESVPTNTIPPQISKTRLSGGGRFATSLNIVKDGFKNPVNVIITSGENYPDALASAPLANFASGPILLASTREITPEIVSYIKSGSVKRVIVVGGEENIPTSILKKIAPIETNLKPGDINDIPVG